MENLVHYIYTFVGVIIGIYLLLQKGFSKITLNALVIFNCFYSSSYVFYFITKPINLICTGLILVLWIIVLRLVKSLIQIKSNFSGIFV